MKSIWIDKQNMFTLKLVWLQRPFELAQIVMESEIMILLVLPPDEAQTHPHSHSVQRLWEEEEPFS